jgi:hypothetical protein
VRSAGRQLDLIRHSDAQLIAAHLEAAEYALLNRYESLQERERRAQHHRDEAQRLASLNPCRKKGSPA